MDRQTIETAVRGLRENGHHYLPPLSWGEIQEVNAYLLDQPVHVDAHIPQSARNRGEPDPVDRNSPRALASECVCTPLHDAVLAPHLFERALDASRIAAEYLRRDPPVAYSANAFWTRPGPAGSRPDIQEHHVDQDDERFVVMFTYLTNVASDGDGPHEIEVIPGQFRKLYGPPGTMFMADTSRLHRGIKPVNGARGIHWFRWGVSDRPPAGVWDGNMPIPRLLLGDRYPGDPWLRECFELLVTP